jgi:hypothetical protein
MAEEKKFAPNPKETFTANKSKYYVLVHACNIPGLGVRTAAEILVDKQAQEYLVENKCEGTIIAKIEEPAK